MQISKPQNVVVVGSGLMSPGIAAALLGGGIAVTIAGRSAERVDNAVDLAKSLVGRSDVKLRGGPLASATFANADLVIESIVEDEREKSNLLSQIEGWMRPTAVLATNTSSISIRDLASRLKRPELFGGLHFLNPANLTSVVEVVVPEGSSTTVAQKLELVAKAMGKFPIVVRRDMPGFVWNRLQAAMIRECLYLIDENVADAATLDLAVSEGLAPRWMAAGPLGTADLGGVDTFARMAEGLFPLLSSNSSPTGVLSPERGPEVSFRSWDASTKEKMLALRDEAVMEGNRLAAERRTVLGSPISP